MKPVWITIAAIIVVFGALAVWGLYGLSAPGAESILSPVVVEPTPVAPPPTTTIQLALLDTAGVTDGKPRGCDRVVMSERSIAATTTVLNAAMRELFAEEREQVSGAFNFIARTNNTLTFDRAVVEGTVAKIYLTGTLSGLAGVCDDPRAQIQIEETALQFPTVRSVEIYLNGNLDDLNPSER